VKAIPLMVGQTQFGNIPILSNIEACDFGNVLFLLNIGKHDLGIDPSMSSIPQPARS